MSSPNNHVALSRALAAENLSFPVYALLNAVSDHGGPMKIAGISLATGYSYWAVRNQIRRTSWFLVGGDNKISLTPDGSKKLKQVEVKLSENENIGA